MAQPPDEPVIEFSIRQLLADIRHEVTAGFARVEARLETKADKTEVIKLQSDVTWLDRKVDTIEDWKRATEIEERARKAHAEERHAQAESRRSHKQWLIGGTVTVVAGVGAALIEALVR